ncbi:MULTISPECIES: acyl-CoA dehydrogenase family protein [unclassified Curtobacterium]|uniref:acyl-CoA dehydrogenase family protein n=1 Tax=unclassified Curtobacterium TaxID=257496 RepID=UPI0037FD5C3E
MPDTLIPAETAPTTLHDVAAAVRAVAARAAEDAVRREIDGTSPAETVRALADAGLGAVRVPLSHGGVGGTVGDLAELLVEVAAADSNLAQIVRGHLGFVEFLLARPADAVRDELLRAAGRGELFGPAASVHAGGVGDAGPASTIIDTSTWLDRADGVRLTGEKYYTTGSLYSEWLNVLVVEDGTVFEVVVRRDDPGVTIVDDWDGFGQRATASGTTRFDRVQVRDGHVLPYDVPRLSEYLGAFYQFVHSATQAGILRRASADLAEVVRRRRRTYPLASDPDPKHDPQVLEAVGEVASAAFGALAAVEAVARTIDRLEGLEDADGLDQVVVASAAAQVRNTALAGEALWRFFDAASASAVATGSALDRHWRNARTISSHNPVVYKARLVGDHAMNGTLPTATI